MWTWLSRVFRSSGAAQRAEAEGRIDDAAKLYVDAGDRAEAVRVFVRAGETARTLEERRGFYTRAYGLARTDDLRDIARKGLCMVALAEAEEAAPRSDEERRRLHEAAEDLERLGAFRDAGRAWLLLEDRDAVLRVLTLAGDVDGLEALTGKRDEADRKGLRRRGALEGFDALWRSGDRQKALEELRVWVGSNGEDHEARSALDAKTATLLRDGRCEVEHDGAMVLVVGRFPVVLGRETDVSVRGASVSRRHAVIDRDASGGFVIRDAGSRAGTTLDGVGIAADFALKPGSVVGLGGDVALRVHGDDASLVLEIERGMDRGRRIALVAEGYSLGWGTLRFDARGPVLAPTSAVSLNGQKVALEFVLVRGDRVEAAEHVLLVR